MCIHQVEMANQLCIWSACYAVYLSCLLYTVQYAVVYGQQANAEFSQLPQ